LDVFTDHVLAGNQLAVFPDARGLDADLMQKIALEMAFSETTFVFPAEDSTTDFRLRIFTPRSELPMAGHPTIGTTFGLAAEGRIESGRPAVWLGLGIGPTEVALEWESSRLQFAWMTQPLPKYGSSLTEFARMAEALQIREADIRRTNLPIQVVSCGVPFLFVPVESREAVDRAELDRSALLRFCKAVGIDEVAVFVFSLEAGPDASVYSRMFAPASGVPEDPATGGASGPLGCYLVQHRSVGASQAKALVSLQGVKMGRPSRIHISIDSDDGRIKRVRIGGQSALLGEGMIRF
jgi:trans-2,3-dihydro-3-hydroxyanthranilate isomerase